MNSEQNLFDSDRWLPAFLFIQNRQADSARRVNVGVKEWWRELAYALLAVKFVHLELKILHFGGLVGYSVAQVSEVNVL